MQESLKVFDPKKMDLTAVTLSFGIAKPNESRFSAETRKMLEAQGVTVLTATHAFSGVPRGLAGKHGGTHPAEVMADTPAHVLPGHEGWWLKSP